MKPNKTKNLAYVLACVWFIVSVLFVFQPLLLRNIGLELDFVWGSAFTAVIFLSIWELIKE